MQTEIRKGKGIEGLVENAPIASEEESNIKTVEEPDFKALMRQYETCLEATLFNNILIRNWNLSLSKAPTPNTINTVLQTTIAYKHNKGIGSMNYGWNTGVFITKLIQKSYDAGHNDFRINVKQLPGSISNLGKQLTGKEDRPIQLTIIGNPGSCCGHYSEYLDLRIEGCHGYHFGENLKNSTFYISGALLIGGADYFGKESENSIFKTSGKDYLDRMLREVPDSNRVVFVHPDGTEEVKRDY